MPEPEQDLVTITMERSVAQMLHRLLNEMGIEPHERTPLAEMFYAITEALEEKE